MNKIVNGYLDFINESKLELLLEAKIQFLPRFTNLLSKINSPITKALEEIIGKDVDVNTNFIDISTKDDSISFIPDDKVDSVNYVVTAEPFNLYTQLAQTARTNKSYPIGKVADPMEGTVGKIVHELTNEELNKILPSTNWEYWQEPYRLVHFSWDNGRNNTFIKKSGLKLDVSDYKSTEYKVGKFVNKILTNAGYVIGTHSNCNFTPVQVEDFVNKYKTQMKLRNNTLSRFEIVKGEDIRKYYLFSNYFKMTTGSLGGSCMRHKSCQPYFDIYVDNPEQVSMVILRQEDGHFDEYVDEDTGEIIKVPIENKITGRAILWTDNKGRKIMDRIYVNDTADIEFFKEFANKNGLLYKKEQDFNEDTPLMLNQVQLTKEESIIKVQLHENVDYDEYPYMDTLKYYVIRTGILTNEEIVNKDYYLEGTEGNRGPCNFCGGFGEVGCPECLGTGSEECPDCEGVRGETCDFCDGRKIMPCPSCDGNDSDCDFCKGKGEVNCPECDGEGMVDCEKCGGAGDITCRMCNGAEEVDCPDCR